MEFSSGAFATGFSTGAFHGDEATAEEGFIMEDLGKSGSGPAFFICHMDSGKHMSHLLLSDILLYIRK